MTRALLNGIGWLACAAALPLFGALAAHAQLAPEWLTTIPAGTSLSAGLQGAVTDAAGVTYVTATSGTSSNSNVLTAAIDTDGEILWQHTFNGPADWHDQARGIALGPGGVVYVTGNTPGPGSYANILLLKYEAATGALLDTTIYSSAPQTAEHGASVAADALGNVYIGGGTVGDGSDGLVVSFDSTGEFRWAQDYDGPAWGPFSQDNILQVKVAPDGHPIAMIHGVMGSNHPDYVVIKYNSTDGEPLWQANWGSNGGDFATDMEIDAAGDVYVTGTGINFTDQYSTIKLDGDSGALIWQAYDFIGNDDAAYALAIDGDAHEGGGVYITGTSDPEGNHSNFNDNFYTIKRSAADGTQLWTHFYGLNCVGCYDVARDVLTDSTGHTFVVGSTSSPPYSGDFILFVLDSGTGEEIDRSVLGAGPNELANGSILRFDANENLYVAGQNSNVNIGEKILTAMKYASFAPPTTTLRRVPRLPRILPNRR